MLNPKPDIDRQEAELEQLLDEVEFQASDSDLTPEKRRERRKATRSDPLAFAETYFPQVFTDPFNDLHRHLASLDEGRYSVSGFPQAGKSAFAFLGKLLHHIARGDGGVAVVAARTDDKATAHTVMLSRIIRKNKLLCYDYNIETLKDKAGNHLFKSEGGQTRLVAGSVNKGIRGTVSDDFSRITIAVGDDLYDRETARSETDNKRVYDWITGELWRQLEDDALCIILGNSINEHCPIILLKDEFPDRHFSFPILDHNDTPTWPEKYSREDVQELKEETPYDVWMGEYKDEPAEKGDIFDPTWLRTVNLAITEILASVTAIDPSHGQSPHACLKGMATLGVTQKREPVVLDLYGRQEGYEEVFDYLLELRRRFSAHHKAILFENDFSQWNFAKPYYDSWREDRKVTLPIIMHLASETATEFRGSDKESRIMNLVHPHQTGQVRYLNQVTGTGDWKVFRRQYLAFGEAKEKLDVLDALATAYIMVYRYIERGSFKPLKKRAFGRPTWSGGFR